MNLCCHRSLLQSSPSRSPQPDLATSPPPRCRRDFFSSSSSTPSIAAARRSGLERFSPTTLAAAAATSTAKILVEDLHGKRNQATKAKISSTRIQALRSTILSDTSSSSVTNPPLSTHSPPLKYKKGDPLIESSENLWHS
ncbi:hypothetical protein U1Q18_020736 [Sarracenia purpurea var. burkii]